MQCPAGFYRCRMRRDRLAAGAHHAPVDGRRPRRFAVPAPQGCPAGARGVAVRPFPDAQGGMLATVCDTTDRGVGIAAPQVGVSRRLIAVQRFDKPGEPFCFYVNPEIVWYSQTRLPGSERVPFHPRCLGQCPAFGEDRRPVPGRGVPAHGRRYGRRVHGRHFSSTRSTIWTACCSSTGCCRGSPCPVVARSIPVALVCPLLSPFASGTPRLRSGYSGCFREPSVALFLHTLALLLSLYSSRQPCNLFPAVARRTRRWGSDGRSVGRLTVGDE